MPLRTVARTAHVVPDIFSRESHKSQSQEVFHKPIWLIAVHNWVVPGFQAILPGLECFGAALTNNPTNKIAHLSGRHFKLGVIACVSGRPRTARRSEQYWSTPQGPGRSLHLLWAAQVVAVVRHSHGWYRSAIFRFGHSRISCRSASSFRA